MQEIREITIMLLHVVTFLLPAQIHPLPVLYSVEFR